MWKLFVLWCRRIVKFTWADTRMYAFRCSEKPHFVNVEIGKRLREWGVDRVFYTRQLRRAIEGWNNTSIQLHHSHLGGVPLGTVRLTAAFRTAAPGVLPIHVIAPRDASTVLSFKGIVHNYRRAPPVRHTATFTCDNVGTPSKPIFHGRGWFPARIDRPRCTI
jgi:hypothetical protein